ncbi:MAG: aromatic ring-hydroxylating dioxygenase subunit alpha [Gammaproteobacteria bacterium]|nr:MAG: aromatic ring-hydroxylating dioxygenase subunit alpha [Gammaproteobacteria bacterium]
MFINFWYPAGLSAEIGENPVRRRMLGQDFVLWRDPAGQVHCLSNTCIHRGGSLAGGKVRDGEIACPYHGWRFAGDGRCTRIPSLGLEARIPGRARVDAYPTAEKYGLVFAFLGDLPEEERCPIMEIPEFRGESPDEGWRATIQHFDWDFDYQRSMENGIDGAHNEYVHPTHGYSGEREDIRIAVENYRWVDDEWDTGFFSSRRAPPLADKKMRDASGRHGDAVITGGTGHHGVSMIWTLIHPTDAMSIHQYLFETPIEDGRTSLYLVNLRNFLIDPSEDARMMGRNEVVATQDRDVLYDVQPVLTPRTRTKEFFTPADTAIAKYRDKLQAWEDRGWRIDTDTVRRNSRRVAYAIPSPARRTQTGWVLDPVPLVAARAAAREQGTASRVAGGERTS